MGEMAEQTLLSVCGIGLRCAGEADWLALRRWLDDRQLSDKTGQAPDHWCGPGVYCLGLSSRWLHQWVPGFDTTGLQACLPRRDDVEHWNLDQEIIVGLLASPVRIEFPSFAELQSSIRIRRYIAMAGARTALAFDTDAAERPEDAWTYDEERGFTVLPGICVIEALRKATQPEITGQLYSFSCYRATEYVMTLGIAQELQSCNPELFIKLQRQCESRVVRSGQFHDVFLREYGTQDHPLPTHYYVPGDRVWFRNPDEHSSDVMGFEGSWVLYLGAGLFSNFWKRNQPFSIEDKCLEIFHWRHGVSVREDGTLIMDEVEVERCVALSRADPQEHQAILMEMLQPRAAKGIYGRGGCIDTTRESPRWVCPGTADLVMPLID
jgi:hypothetical protein